MIHYSEGDLILDEKNDKHCTLDLFGADLTASIKCTEKAIFIRCKPSSCGTLLMFHKKRCSFLESKESW